MKTTAKCPGTGAGGKGVCAAASVAEPVRPPANKVYVEQVNELALPVAEGQGKSPPVRQFQLALLAAALGKDAGKDVGAGDLVAKALQIWNAAGRALFVQQATEEIVCGLFTFERDDWEQRCGKLIGLLNDMEGAVPGQNPSEQVRRSYELAQHKASSAVAQLWKYGPRNSEVLKRLFPAKSETEKTRGQKVVALVEFARAKVEGCDELAWRAKDGDRLKGCILHAWEPLGVPQHGAELPSALKQAAELLKSPSEAQNAQLGFYPIVARWLAVMRQEQGAEAKNRS